MKPASITSLLFGLTAIVASGLFFSKKVSASELPTNSAMSDLEREKRTADILPANPPEGGIQVCIAVYPPPPGCNRSGKIKLARQTNTLQTFSLVGGRGASLL